QPQIASVGLTEPEAREQGREVKVGKFPFLANGRALIHGEPGGFAKLVADAKTGQLLGAHIVGVEATELIAEPALARLFQGDAWEVSRNIHPHPTLSEVVGEAALAVDGSAIHIEGGAPPLWRPRACAQSSKNMASTPSATSRRRSTGATP